MSTGADSNCSYCPIWLKLFTDKLSDLPVLKPEFASFSYLPSVFCSHMQEILTCSLKVMARPNYPREWQNSLFLGSKTMFGNCNIAIGESLSKQKWMGCACSSGCLRCPCCFCFSCFSCRRWLLLHSVAVALCCWQMVVMRAAEVVNWDPFAKSRTIDSCRALGMACVLSW